MSEGISLLFILESCDCKLRCLLICLPTCCRNWLFADVADDVDEKALQCCFESASVVRRSEDGTRCLPAIVVGKLIEGEGEYVVYGLEDLAVSGRCYCRS